MKYLAVALCLVSLLGCSASISCSLKSKQVEQVEEEVGENDRAS